MINNDTNIQKQYNYSQIMPIRICIQYPKNHINIGKFVNKKTFNNSEEQYIFDQFYYNNISNIYKYFDKIKEYSYKLQQEILQTVCVLLLRIDLFDLTDKQFFHYIYLLIKLLNHRYHDKLLYTQALFIIKKEFSRRTKSIDLNVPWYISFIRIYKNNFMLNYYKRGKFQEYSYDYDRLTNFFNYDKIKHTINNELYNIVFYCGKQSMTFDNNPPGYNHISDRSKHKNNLTYNQWNIYLLNISHINKELLIWSNVARKLRIYYYFVSKYDKKKKISDVSMIRSVETFHVKDCYAFDPSDVNYFMDNYIRLFYIHVNKEAKLMYDILKNDSLKVIMAIRSMYVIDELTRTTLYGYQEVKTILFVNRGNLTTLRKIMKKTNMITNKKNITLNKSMKHIINNYFLKNIIPNKYAMKDIEIYTVTTTKPNKLRPINLKRNREMVCHYDLSRQRDKFGKLYFDMRFDNKSTKSIIKRSYKEYKNKFNNGYESSADDFTYEQLEYNIRY